MTDDPKSPQENKTDRMPCSDRPIRSGEEWSKGGKQERPAVKPQTAPVDQVPAPDSTPKDGKK